MTLLQQEIRNQVGEDPLANPNYGHIINDKHYDRLCGMLEGETVLSAGNIFDGSRRKIAPVILEATPESKCMQEEIFGPVMPILTYDSIDQVIEWVNGRDKPLALYIFAKDKGVIRKVTGCCAYGGGCVNDVVIHLATSNMGFGGVGESGMGSYHGKIGFDTFTHYKSIVDKKTWLDLPMRYQPYSKLYAKMIRLFLK